MKENFKIISLNISETKGIKKTPISQIMLIDNFGIKGDAHGGTPQRQVSLLAHEDVELMQQKLSSIKPGDFAENITTCGIDLPSLPIGTILYIGDTQLQVTKIGKECHHGCEIQQLTGDCIMPKRGIFAQVLKGGIVTTNSEGFVKR